MNTKSRNFTTDKKESTSVVVPFKIVLMISAFILALIGSWSLDGLFFTELFVGGIIVCTLMWCREVSLKIEKDFQDNTSYTQN